MSAFRTAGEARPRPKKKKTKRSPGPRGRIAKRTGDLRSKPEERKKADALDVGPEAAPATLSGKARRHLRSLGHHLEPIVQIGKDGVTDGVVAAARAALHAHELVKVKVSADAPVDRGEAGKELSERAGAALAQVLGRTLLLYKRHPHKPRIVLPAS